MSVYILLRIAAMSMCACAVTLLAFCLERASKRLFSAKWHYITYILCLLVFLVPISYKAKAPVQAATQNIYDVYPVIAQTAEKATPTDTDTGVLCAMANIYFVIAAGIFVFHIVSYLVFMQRVGKGGISSLDGGDTSIQVYVCDVSVPMLVGVVKPRLLLPEGEYSPEDLHNILIHESVHMKRRDCLVRWLCVIARSLHFFNPVVYLLCKRINEWCEISCDISATQKLDEHEIKSYCNTILTFASRTSPPFSLGVGGTKRQLERRFKSIMQNKKISKKAAIVSAVVTGCILVSALSASALLGGKVEKPVQDKNSHDTSSKSDIQVYDGGYEQENQKEPELAYVFDSADNVEIQKGEHDVPVLVKYTDVTDGKKSTNMIVYNENDGGEILYVVPVNEGDVYVSKGYVAGQHEAIDYAAPSGTPVRAPFDGKVVSAAYDAEMGNHIVIDNGEGYSATLAHLESMDVREGSTVSGGDIIGKVGSSGKSTGAHVHLEIVKNT